MGDNVSWLTTVPANDGNFKYHLKYATVEELEQAIAINREKRRKIKACGLRKGIEEEGKEGSE